MTPREHVKESARAIITRWLIGIVVVSFCGGLIFLPALSTHEHKRSCMSNLKTLNLGVIMYAGDSEDKYPPYYTFDGEVPTKIFRTVVMPYCRDELDYLCPQDKESKSGQMSFVHPYAFIGTIPNFKKGNRIFVVTIDSPTVATTAYLRDPIRFDPKSNPQQIHSPHSEVFNVAYLDGHVKAREHLNINTDF